MNPRRHRDILVHRKGFPVLLLGYASVVLGQISLPAAAALAAALAAATRTFGTGALFLLPTLAAAGLLRLVHSSAALAAAALSALSALGADLLAFLVALLSAMSFFCHK